MEFSERLGTLQQRVATARTAVEAAASESHEEVGKRIDQAQADLDRAAKHTQQPADTTGTKWAQMRADAAAKMEDVKAKIDKRGRELDAQAAAGDADWADANAADAIGLAEWAVDNAELVILDAIDAHAYADELARAARS